MTRDEFYDALDEVRGGCQTVIAEVCFTTTEPHDKETVDSVGILAAKLNQLHEELLRGIPKPVKG